MTEALSTDALLERLLHHPLPEIELSLARIGLFLERVGNPHLALPPVVHVAGTNGKGSLIAFLRAMLEAAGYRCHVYISPHLVRFHERIVVAGEEIGDVALQKLLARVVKETEDFPLTFFESTTVAAFLAFVETPADIVLLETGMGGRLDATNLIPQPALTAITPVSFDHTEFLGDTLAKIAGEKAGIMKPGVPCVIGRQEAEALAALKEHARQVGAPLVVYGEDYDDNALRREGVKLSLPGAFQYTNAAAAAACAEQLRERFPKLDAGAIRRGMESARWAARLQRLEGGAYNRLLGEGRALWLDGGHNPSAGAVLAEWVRERDIKPHLVMGMLQDKDAAGYLEPLAPYLASLTAVPVPDEPKSRLPGQLHDIAENLGILAFSADSVEEALRALGERAEEGAEVLIGGSLYLAGAVLAKNHHDSSATVL